jgi:hypothetical protein
LTGQSGIEFFSFKIEGLMNLDSAVRQATQPSWQLYYWRDRSKEADFLLHKAGRFKIADAKWAEHPSNAGKLEKVRVELPDHTPAALFCRTNNSYSVTSSVEAIPLLEASRFLE